MINSNINSLNKLKICINTSVSALDDEILLKNSFEQYEKLKPYCNSILRVVTCDFNTSHPDGFKYNKIQESILETSKVLDTVFRPSKNNPLVKNGIIKTKMKRFIKGKQLVSKLNKKSYLGKCSNCKEMCGVNL